MAIRLAAAAQSAFNAVYAQADNDALDAAFDLMDAGAGAGQIQVYSGSAPASAGTAPSGTLLATFTTADPAWSPAAGQTKALDADPDLTTTASASGAPGYARGLDSNGTVVFDGTVTTTGGGGDFITSSSPWASGQQVDLTSGSVDVS